MFGDDQDDTDPTAGTDPTPAWQRDPRISGNVKAMRAQGASEAEVQDYLTRIEKIGTTPSPAPASPAPPASSPSAAPPPPSRSGSTALDLAREFVGQGAMFGFGDEAEAGARALFGNDSYSANLSRIRGQNQAFEQDHPIASKALKIAGAIAPVAATAGMSLLGDAAAGGAAVAADAAPSLAARLGKGAAMGAGFGALAGAGDAPGGDDFWTDVANRAKGAGKAALPGAVFGGIVPLGAGAGTMGRMGATAAGGFAAGLTGEEENAPDDESFLDKLKRGAMAGIVPMMLGGGVTAGVEATGRMAPAIANAIGAGGEEGMVRRANTRAQDLVVQRMRRDGMSVDDIAQQAQTLGLGTKPVTLMDAVGKGTRRLAAAAVATPSTASSSIPQFLENRAADNAGRIASDLETATGMPTVQEPTFMQGMHAAAQPVINDAYARAWTNTPPINTAPIADVMGTSTFQKADALARTRNAEEVAGTRPGETPVPRMGSFTERQQIDTPDGPQNIEVPSPTVDARDLDQVKRMLDNEIGQRQANGDVEGVRTLTMMKNKMVSEIDAQAQAGGSTDYRDARLVAQTHLRKVDAFKLGEQFLSGANGDASMLKDQLMNMTSDERTMWRQGAQLAKVRQLRNVADGGNAARQTLGAPEDRARLQLVVDNPQRWQKFSDALDAEKQFGQTQREVAQGSRTTPLGLDVAEMATGVNPGTLAADAGKAVQNPVGFAFGKLLGGGAKAYNERILGIRGNVADAVGRTMMAGVDANGAPNAAGFNRILDQLRQRQQTQYSILGRYLAPVAGQQFGSQP